MKTTGIKYCEEGLITSIRHNSREIFNYLYFNYGPALFTVINKIVKDEHTAEDVLQETFVSIWKNIDQYDAGKGRLYTWMHNIAKNKAIDFMRSGPNNMKNLTDSNDNKIYTYASHAFQKTDNIGVTSIVMSLSPKYQNVIYLAYYKGHTFEEMAGMLNIPIGTIRSRMRRALILLRGHFKYGF